MPPALPAAAGRALRPGARLWSAGGARRRARRGGLFCEPDDAGGGDHGAGVGLGEAGWGPGLWADRPSCPLWTAHRQVFLYFSEDQGKDEDAEEHKEAGVGVDPAPGLQRPKRISQFLDDPSTEETVL